MAHHTGYVYISWNDIRPIKISWLTLGISGPRKARYESGDNHSLAPLPDLLPAKNGEEQTVQFLLEVVDILLNYVRKTFDRSTKVLDFHHPHQLLEGMEGFNLELSDHPESLEQILVDCRDTLKYGVRTGKNESQAGMQQYPCPAPHPFQL